jgi:prefoldin beta subunit
MNKVGKMSEQKQNVQEKINKLSKMEHSLQSFLAQKQAFQSQLLELQSALEALEKTEEAYKIVGNVMVKSDKHALAEDLKEKKEMVELRIKSVEKQENNLREKTAELQSEVMKIMSE